MGETKDKKARESVPSRKVKYVLDVPRSYFEICLSQAKTQEDKQEIRKILESTKHKRN